MKWVGTFHIVGEQNYLPVAYYIIVLSSTLSQLCIKLLWALFERLELAYNTFEDFSLSVCTLMCVTVPWYVCFFEIAYT